MLSSLCCPFCTCDQVKFKQFYRTSGNGLRRAYVCLQCNKSFSETKNTPAAGLRTNLSKVAQVLKARSEGIGFNACARTFQISTRTLRIWENRFAKLKKSLFLYSLCHQFIEQTIEGDELYTKVGQNKPARDSEGWTIILMERASKFIWHMECGRRQKRLFKRAIAALVKVAQKTEQTTLLTDGEKRYGTTLLEVCSETIRTGKRGRPKKLYPKACG